MLFLLFQLGSDRYALAAEDVVEVLPLIALKQLPQAPKGITGLLNYRGQPVPVLDLSLLALGQPAAQRVSTRLLIMRCTIHEPKGMAVQKFLGLLVERATETIAKEPSDFVPAGVETPGARYLGPVAPDPRGFIQRIELDVLLNDELRAALLLTAPEEVAP
jgi:chemotaxis-related protein WspB